VKISREEVLRVAQLANLGLSGDEAEKYRAQLDAILEYIDKLNRLNVDTIEPMAQILQRSASTAGGNAVAPAETDDSGTREDVLQPCNIGEAILAQAPEAKKPYFRVPKVIER
jgi:aspartyl-tRNA(Asn)/glutamyl-tRNA(Gln) amidotransferase subunit C